MTDKKKTPTPRPKPMPTESDQPVDNMAPWYIVMIVLLGIFVVYFLLQSVL